MLPGNINNLVSKGAEDGLQTQKSKHRAKMVNLVKAETWIQRLVKEI